MFTAVHGVQLSCAMLRDTSSGDILATSFCDGICVIPLVLSSYQVLNPPRNSSN